MCLARTNTIEKNNKKKGGERERDREKRNIATAHTRRGNMEREKRKQKKSAENKKSNIKERKRKIKRIKIFLVCFFWTETERNKILFKTMKKWQHVFEDRAWWNKSTAKMVKQIKKNKGFF